MPRLQDNMIDFPCSQVWVEHYADRDMTEGYPASFYTSPRVTELQGKVAVLENQLKDMTGIKNWFPPKLYDDYSQLLARMNYLQKQIDEVKGRKQTKKRIGVVEL